VDFKVLDHIVVAGNDSISFAENSWFEEKYTAPGRNYEDEPYAPGVTRAIYPWGFFYKGSTDALVAAGVVKSKWLPGRPEQLKTVGKGKRRGRRIHIQCRSRSKILIVREFFTRLERSRRNERTE
jgi:hypothetical protein